MSVPKPFQLLFRFKVRAFLFLGFGLAVALFLGFGLAVQFCGRALSMVCSRASTILQLGAQGGGGTSANKPPVCTREGGFTCSWGRAGLCSMRTRGHSRAIQVPVLAGSLAKLRLYFCQPS